MTDPTRIRPDPVSTEEQCEACAGTGHDKWGEVCRECGGAGVIYVDP